MACSRHPLARAAIFLLVTSIPACAGDSGDEGADSGPTGGDDSGPGTDGATSGTTASGDDDSNDDSTAGDDEPGTGNDDAPTTTGDSGPTTGVDSTGAESSTGDSTSPVELANDGWFDGANTLFEMGFVDTECWASVYVPSPGDYPFVVDATTMIVGGDDMGTGDFYVGLWSVDAMNMPESELGSAALQLSGANADFDAVNLGIAGIESPVYDEGNFAIVVCLMGHDGFPAIAADGDGQIDYPDRNWIRLADGTWLQSNSVGVGGDWIMRAVVIPSG